MSTGNQREGLKREGHAPFSFWLAVSGRTSPPPTLPTPTRLHDSFGNKILALRVSWVVALCSLAASAELGRASAVGPTVGRHSIHDAGCQREFEVATDALCILTPRPGFIRIAPLDSAASLRDYAVTLQKARGVECALVLYETGATRHDYTRRVLTREVLVRLVPGARIEDEMQAVGGPTWRNAGGLEGWVVCRTSAIDGAPELAGQLRRRPGVLYAEALLLRKHQLKFVPNDPFFATQWHLLNTGQNGGVSGIDINVVNVWDIWRGRGVCIGVVDDGLEATHPDLAANVDASLGWNFNDGTPDPSPDPTYDYHGTAAAGVAAASGNNGVGVAGVAFESRLAGLRLLGDATVDSQDAAAMLHSNEVIHVKNNSWGAYDGAGTLEGPGPLMIQAMAQGTTSGRGGKGTIYVFAGGNGRSYGENVNYDGYANSVNAVAVGAVTDQGLQPSYSEPGACLAVVAPSRSSGRQGITTTDLTGASGINSTDYRLDFGGTSAATPSVSGAVGLILECNPNLGYRDVKEVLLRSARKVLPLDADWWTNSAGIAHNHNVGSGLVDVGSAIAMATDWACLGPLTAISQLQTNLSLAVPDNNSKGITRSFDVTNVGFRVEHVVLRVTLPHARYGDLAITLTSPRRTVSRLAETHTSSGASYAAWPLMSVRHWGEPAQGKWTVQIADLASYNTGSLEAVELNLLGSVPSAILEAVQVANSISLTLRAAAAGWRWALEASPDLITWESLATLQIGTSGQASFVDTNRLGPVRFYRARLLP